MKKVLSLILACFLLTGVFAGCGSSEPAPAAAPAAEAPAAAPAAEPAAAPAAEPAAAPASGTYRIGYSMPSRDQFQTSLQMAIEAKAKAEGIELVVLDANTDVATQLSHVQTWEADGFDAVIVGLCNNDSASDILAAAGDMKVVFVNRQPSLDVLQDGKVVYVGTDETLYGTEQGNFLADLLKAEGKTEVDAVMFMGELGLDNVTKRTNSAKESLEANGIKANYVYETTANWDRITAMNLFSQFMGSGQNVDIVICNNDEMALGVIEAMKTTGDGSIICPVVGIDATDVGCESVKAGDMACSVFQDPVAQGEGTIICALGLLRGEPIEGLENNYYNITPQLVTSENVDNFMK